MSTLEEDGITTDRLLELIRRRITQWEQAEPHSRTEHEMAEAFTRAFAELDAALTEGASIPAGWLLASSPARAVRAGTVRLVRGEGP